MRPPRAPSSRTGPASFLAATSFGMRAACRRCVLSPGNARRSPPRAARHYLPDARSGSLDLPACPTAGGNPPWGTSPPVSRPCGAAASRLSPSALLATLGALPLRVLLRAMVRAMQPPVSRPFPTRDKPRKGSLRAAAARGRPGSAMVCASWGFCRSPHVWRAAHPRAGPSGRGAGGRVVTGASREPSGGRLWLRPFVPCRPRASRTVPRTPRGPSAAPAARRGPPRRPRPA